MLLAAICLYGLNQIADFMKTVTLKCLLERKISARHTQTMNIIYVVMPGMWISKHHVIKFLKNLTVAVNIFYFLDF